MQSRKDRDDVEDEKSNIELGLVLGTILNMRE
jgi:hypothetical protein